MSKDASKKVGANPFTQMSEAELTAMSRDQLAAQMDQDIDAFMEQMIAERRAKQDSEPVKKEFDFEAVCKEIDNHPAFMTSLPNPNTDAGGEYNEMIQALQAMKYDEDDEPEDRAITFKTDGTKCFKYKQYKNAVAAYTEGIKVQCPNRELNAQLYNNRAAAHVHLGNYRSAAKDCVFALRFQPDYFKAAVRGIDCFLRLRLPEKVRQILDDIERHCPGLDENQSKQVKEMEQKYKKLSAEIARDERKAKKESSADYARKLRMKRALDERGLTFTDPSHSIPMPSSPSTTAQNLLSELDDFRWEALEVDLPQLSGSRPKVQFAKIDEAQTEDETPSFRSPPLRWPVMLLYPEFGQSDFVQQFHECQRFETVMTEVLSEQAGWDESGRYTSAHLDRMELFFDLISAEDAHGADWQKAGSNKKTIRLSPKQTLQSLLKNQQLTRLKTPMLEIMVVRTDSPFFSSKFAVNRNFLS